MIDFGTPDARLLLRGGWHDDEQQGDTSHVWAGEREVHLLLPWGVPAAVEAELVCRGLPLQGEASQVVAVQINQQEVHRFTTSPEWSVESFPIPAETLRPGWNALTFRFSRLDLPRNLGLPSDPRALAAAFQLLRLLPEVPPPPRLPEPWCAIPSGGRISWIFPEAPEGIFSVRTSGSPDSAPKILAAWRSDRGIVGDPISVASAERRDLQIHPPASEGPLALTIWAEHRQPPGWVGLRVEQRKPPPASVAEPDPLPMPRPNLLLVVADATHAAHLGAWGACRSYTPCLDRLARRGFQYADASSAAPYTLASVGTLLTGLFPPRHGVQVPGDKLSPEVPTLTERLRAAGYATALVTAMPYASSLLGYQRGFDETIEPCLERAEAVPGDELVQSAAGLLRRLGMGPWFLYIHLREPHEPYDPPRELELLDGGAPVDRDRYLGTMHDWDHPDCPPDALRDLRRLYDGNLRDADRLIESLLRELQRTGQAARTWTVVASDHGEAFGQHGRIRHNSTVYQEMLHVPLIVIPPTRRTTPRLHGEPVSLADLVPTLCALAGARPPEKLDGRPLPGLPPGGTDRGARPLYARTASHAKDAGSPQIRRSIRWRRWKGIYYPLYRSWELFDLRQDPGERHDLQTDPGEQRSRVRNHPVIRDLMTVQLRRIEAQDRAIAESSTASLDPQVREQLRGLGYVQD